MKQFSSAKFDRVNRNHSVSDRDALRIPRAYKDTMKVAGERERLLRDARRYSPISLVLAFWKIPQTVLVRLVRFPIVWILVGVYAALAALTRTGAIDLGLVDSNEIEGSASVLVTFVVVFFVTFCCARAHSTNTAQAAAQAAAQAVAQAAAQAVADAVAHAAAHAAAPQAPQAPPRPSRPAAARRQ